MTEELQYTFSDLLILIYQQFGQVIKVLVQIIFQYIFVVLYWDEVPHYFNAKFDLFIGFIV